MNSETWIGRPKVRKQKWEQKQEQKWEPKINMYTERGKLSKLK